MTFIADLHIHSKYSRATAKNLDLENIYRAAQIKGIAVVGTGDFTYPAWMEEIESKLEETEPGLFSLKREIAGPIDETLPVSCRKKVRFMLQTEISNIYKREGRVRKNHNLIYFPDLLAVKRFNARLEGIGNIKSDGRPILGLDARALLEIVLETCDRGFFVPAHIWTPWFSMFGSKSGFDTIEECFGDLKDHIFAVETGLSSDPPMNFRVSDLDHVSLMSNSDAHSPGYLGRNASVFHTDLDYFAMRSALEARDPNLYHGTLDMFPHQGKYHYDGHRKCNVCLNPGKTLEYGGICPACKTPLTLGVLYRVQQLASRREGYLPGNRPGYTHIIPLTDILAEISQTGPRSKRVTTYYQKAIDALGPELPILTDHSFEEIQRAGVPLLAEAIMKMRTGDIQIDPGFDGEFGKVNIFSRQERETLRGEKTLLFSLPVHQASTGKNCAPLPGSKKTGQAKPVLVKPVLVKPVLVKSVLGKNDSLLLESSRPERESGLLEGLNPDQRQAVESVHRAILIQAGPGTGKTRTLTARIAYLICERKTDPGSILALTFTNKAASQLSQRIDAFLPRENSRVMAATFHGFCLKLLTEYFEFDAGLMTDTLRLELIKKGLETAVTSASTRDNGGRFSGKKGLGELDRMISLCKQQLLGPSDDLSPLVGGQDAGVFCRVYTAYQQQCREKNLVDFEELIFLFYFRLIASPEVLNRVQKRFAHIFIDEYQDLNHGQYELVKLLARKSSLVVIGDPDQSIYGFRGSDNAYFKRFAADYPCEQIFLHQNYRSTQTILDASFQMISRSAESGSQKIFSTLHTAQRLIIKETSSETSEAVSVGKMIETLVGGLSFFSMDARNMDARKKEYSFSDFAVLFRTRKQSEAFAEVFQKQGIPFQTADKKNAYSQDGIQQVLSLLRIITHRAHETDYQVIKDHLKGTGQIQGGLDPVFEKVQGQDSLACLQTIIDRLKIASKIRQTDALATTYARLLSLARLYPVPKEFMDYLVLDQDPDHLTGGVERVSLLTLHSAKGLEYPVVFVTGCEQGLIPFARQGGIWENLEEERRLFYVGMTRAMDILCLTYAQKRRIYGISQERQRSFFIDDIEKRLALYEKNVARAMEKRKPIQLELF